MEDEGFCMTTTNSSFIIKKIYGGSGPQEDVRSPPFPLDYLASSLSVDLESQREQPDATREEQKYR